jgi:hypothetical protein
MNKAMQYPVPFLGWTLAWLAAACLGLGVLTGRASAAPADDAAKWKTLEEEIPPVYKERKELGSRTSRVRGVLSGAVPFAGNEAAFEEYYVKYLFPSWTLTDDEHLGALAKDRDRFLTIDLGKSTGAVHDKLVELTNTKMSQIAQDPDLHPGVRYNAVLVLGALNAKEADRVARTNPEPLPKAFPVLAGLFQNAEESDAVRVAALLGILRHLEWDDYRVTTSKLAADEKAAIVQQLIALAQTTEPPAGRSLEGHTWMRRRALEGLMYFSLAGPSQEIAGVLEKLIADEAEPIALRCTAADIMGRLNYKAPVLPAAEINGKELGLLALAACDAELTRLENEEKLASLRTKMPSQYGSGVAAGMPGMMGGMMSGQAGVPPPGMMGASGSAPPTMDSSMMQGMMGGAGGGKGKKKTSKSKGKAGGSPIDMMMGGMPSAVPRLGAPKADNKSYRMDYLRRRLRSWLYAVQVGLGDERANPFNEVTRSGTGKNAKYDAKYTRGVAAYTQTDDQRTEIRDIIARVQNIVSVVETPEMTYETFVEELRAKMKDLEQITGPLKVEAAEPAAEGPAAIAPVGAAAIPDGPADETPAARAARAPKTSAPEEPSVPATAPPAAAPPAAASPAAPAGTKTP